MGSIPLISGPSFWDRNPTSSNLARKDDAVGGVNIAQHIAGEFFDEIGIRLVGVQQGHVMAKTGAHSLETADLKFNEIRSLEQCRARLETMPSVNCVMGEVGRRGQA